MPRSPSRISSATSKNGYQVYDAILEGAAQIAVPALVSTLCICIVFLPMFFLTGVSRFLFVPLAEAVVFAMLASYVLSRTLVPTLALYLLKRKDHHQGPTRNPFARFQRAFEKGFQRLRDGYHRLLTALVVPASAVCPCVSRRMPVRLPPGALPGAGFLPQFRQW